MDAGSTPTMNLPACLVCLLVLLPDWRMAQDSTTVSTNGLDTCMDETSSLICGEAIQTEEYCSPRNTNNKCKRSCGLCESTTVNTTSLDSCKDEMSASICSVAITDKAYCSPNNSVNKCKRSCRLCGTVSTPVPCRDDLGKEECADIITANGSYCNSTNKNNQCKLSCGLCGTVSTPVPCRDDLGKEECADIITANGSYCNSTNKNNQCKLSCGLCGTVSTPVPCRDDLGKEECADIITANGSYCNSTNKNNQCKLSCGLCDATCSDHLPWTLCSELIKKNKFCTQSDRNNGCKMSCGLCKTGSTAGTWPSTVTPSGNVTTVAGVLPSPTTLNQTSGNATTVAGVLPSPTTLNQTSGNVTTVAGVLPSPTTLNQTSGNATTVAGVLPSPTTLNQTLGNVTTVAGVPPSPTSLNQTSGNGTTVAGVPPSPTTLNQTSGNVTTVAGVPPSPTTLNQTSGNVTTDYNGQRMNSSVQLQQNNSRASHSNQTDDTKSVSNDTVRLNVSTGNLALGKPSTQSSTVSGGGAGLANDGKYGTNGTECSRTDPKQSSSWWRVDLQGIYTITSVVILNRKDCCCGVLNSVTIDVYSKDRDITVEDEADGDDSARNCDVTYRPFSCGEKRVLRCAVNVWGRYVWIKQPMPGMTLCEVEIYGESVTGTECPVLRNKNFPSGNFLPTFSTNKRSVGTDVKVTGCRAGQTLLGTKGLKCLPNLQWDNTAPICIENKKNLAYRKKATQSSTLEPGLAGNAVDGDVGQYSCSTTKPLDIRPRWTVDLGGHFSINDVIVVNRRDCCCYHLSNITIAVEAGGDLPPVICATNTPEFACGEMRSFTCPLHTIGRRVFIEKPSPTLTLCEVVIQGKIFIAKECPPLISPSGESGDVPSVQLSSKRRRPGDTVTIRCPRRTSLVGSNLLKCLKSGQWDKQLPMCIDMRTDVAKWKASSLSTTLNGKGAARLANDAKFPSDGRPPRCARSRPDDKRPWWRVDLRAVHTVNKVYVVNGIETCNARFDIKVINKNLMTSTETLKYCVKNAEVKGCGQTDQFRCGEGVVGNMVVIEKHSPVLVLCEVVVIGTRQEVECPSLQGAKYVLSSFSTKEGSEVTINKCTDGLAVSGPKKLKCLRSGMWNKLPPACLDIRENLARNKPASMSSAEHFNVSSAAMAVDGIFDHNFVGTNCSISHMHDTRPWWQVDLQGIYQVQTVTITSRHDSRCLKMRGIHVVVYGEDVIPRNPRSKGNLCDPRRKTLYCGHTLTLTCKPSAVGRYVRVAKYERGLSLCEVVVKGRKQARTDCPPLEDKRLPSGLFNKYNMNGLQATHTSRSRGTELRVGCRNNYRPIGHTSLVCQKTGQWDAEPAVCSAPSKLPWRCPVQEGYFYHVEEDFCFKLETSRTTWYAAVRACAATPGGFLAELNTEVKHQAVHEAVQSLEDYRSTDYYIGGSKFVAPDSWTWMNKMPVNQSNVVRTGSNTQRCLSMSSIDGRYSGLRCLKQLGRVCEKRPSIKDAKQCIDSLVPAKCDTKAIEGLCDSVKSDTQRTMKYKCKRTCGFCSKRNIQRGRCKDKLTYDTCDSIKKRSLCQNPAKRQRCMKTCGKCQDDTKCGANSSLMAGSIAATGALENSPCVYTINSSSRNQTKLFILTIFRFPTADTILVTPPRRFNVTYSLPNTNKTEMYTYIGNSFNLTLVSSTTSTGTRFLLTWEPADSAEAGLEDDMLSVFCNSSAMSVKYKVSGAWRVSLADPSCSVGLVNNTYSITAEFNTCDTKRAENATTTSFSNKLLFILSHGRTFRRFSRIVRCPFPRSPLVYESIGVLQNPQRPPTNTTIWMDIYKGSEKISVFPVIVDYSTAFTILFTTSHPTMASQLQPRDCFMAPSREDRGRFPLITNSCPRGTVNVTWTRRGIHIFVASMQKLTSATEAHIFCTVERCKHAPCRLCYPHTPSKTKVVDLQQGPFIITLPAKSNSTGITQSAPHAAMSDSSVSSSRPGDSEVRLGVKDGKPVSTGDSTTDGYQHRPDVENRSAETEAREPPLSATSDPHWTPSHPSGDPYTSQTPSHPSGDPDTSQTPSHRSGVFSDTSRTPSHPSGGSDTSRIPSQPSGGSDTSRIPSQPSGGSDTSRIPSQPSGGSDTSRIPSHPSGGSDTSRTPSHPSGGSQVPMEIPIPGSESGVLEMPPQNETSHVSGTLSTGTAVGVGVGVVMVSVMAITLAMIKYGPGVKIFKRSNARNPQTKA